MDTMGLGTMRNEVISLSQADILGSDGVIAALQRLTGAFVVLLEPSDAAPHSYELLETCPTSRISNLRVGGTAGLHPAI